MKQATERKKIFRVQAALDELAASVVALNLGAPTSARIDRTHAALREMRAALHDQISGVAAAAPDGATACTV